jgi:hypothetical protein
MSIVIIGKRFPVGKISITLKTIRFIDNLFKKFMLQYIFNILIKIAPFLKLSRAFYKRTFKRRRRPR